MNAQAPTANGWRGRGLAVLVIAGLSVVGSLFFDRPTRQPVTDEPLTQSVPMDPRSEQSRIVAIMDPSVAMDRGIAVQAPLRASESGYPQPARRAAPPSLQFKFLGKITQGDETLVLLYGDGTTLKVRGLGPLNDDYVIDAFAEEYVVLRRVSSGASQIIDLASPGPAPAGELWGGDSAQD